MQVAPSDFFSQSRMGKSVEHISCSHVHMFDFLLSIGETKRMDTPSLHIDPNFGPLPEQNWGRKHWVGNAVGRVKLNYTPTIL